MIVFIRICVFCSFLALNTTHIWAADLSCWSQVGFFTIYPDKYKIKKKKRSCAGQHLSWCRTERLCPFPTGLELISSDSKGHHDQNKFKKTYRTRNLSQWPFQSFLFALRRKADFKYPVKVFDYTQCHIKPGHCGWKKRVLTCKHC